MVRSNVRSFLVGLTLPEVLQFRAERADVIGYIDEWLDEVYAEYEGEPCLTGVMTTAVKLLGTALSLPKGCKVLLTAATNIPGKPVRWFATPEAGWDSGYGSDEDSILIDLADLIDLRSV